MSKPEATVAGKNSLKPNSKENWRQQIVKLLIIIVDRNIGEKKTNEAQAAEWFPKLIDQLLCYRCLFMKQKFNVSVQCPVTVSCQYGRKK